MIAIMPQTDKTPLQTIGYCAGVCWNAPVEDVEKNTKRAISCIDSGHTRTAEYPDVYCIIDGYSARCIRELYTHIIGTTRLQSSTRYVNEEDFGFYTPPQFDEAQLEEYNDVMSHVRTGYSHLMELGVSKEDAANALPLGMDTKIVWKINLRALMHFMNMRLCSRAYKEIRQLSKDLKKELSNYSEEWKVICDKYLVPKCVELGYCNEAKCCGKSVTKAQMLEAIKEWKERRGK